MATITLQEVAPLHKHLNLALSKQDYLPTFEKALKEYGKKANIPGFRKGMVPAGLIKKMYGNNLFVDEVLKTVDRELNQYLQTEKLDIFAQPLPVDMDLAKIDMAQPQDYNFTFEVGMKPDIQVPDLASKSFKRFKVEVTDDMVAEEVAHMQSRYGNMTEPETVSSEEDVLNVTFIETDDQGNAIEGGIQKDNSLLVKYLTGAAREKVMGKQKEAVINIALSDIDERERAAVIKDLGLDESNAAGKHFNIRIDKIGRIENRELNEEFFTQLFPQGDVKSEEDFRNRIKAEIEKQWEAESRNQLQHQIYHALLDETQVSFPDAFLKRWLQTNTPEGQPQKTSEQIEKEFPSFQSGLKWSLISDKLIRDAGIEVGQEDLRNFAKQQLFGYMGMGALDEEQSWVADYVNRMMKDRKYVEDAYQRLQSEKLFEWAAQQVQTEEVPISKEDFIAMNAQHKHEHHEE